MRCRSKLSRFRCASNCSSVSLGLPSPRRWFADSICPSTDLLSQPRATLNYTPHVASRESAWLACFNAALNPGRVWRRRRETQGTHTARIHRLRGCGSASSYAGASPRIRTKSENRPRIDMSPISDVSCLRLPASYMSSVEPQWTNESRPRHMSREYEGSGGLHRAGARGNDW